MHQDQRLDVPTLQGLYLKTDCLLPPDFVKWTICFQVCSYACQCVEAGFRICGVEQLTPWFCEVNFVWSEPLILCQLTLCVKWPFVWSELCVKWLFVWSEFVWNDPLSEVIFVWSDRFGILCEVTFCVKWKFVWNESSSGRGRVRERERERESQRLNKNQGQTLGDKTRTAVLFMVLMTHGRPFCVTWVIGLQKISKTILFLI